MSRIQLALDVVGDMRTLADSIEVLVHALAEGGQDENAQDNGVLAQANTAKQPVEAASSKIPTVSTAPTTPTEPTESTEPKLTLVDLRAFVAERSTPENRPKIKAILNRFGVNKLTELPQEHYEALKREVAAL